MGRAGVFMFGDLVMHGPQPSYGGEQAHPTAASGQEQLAHGRCDLARIISGHIGNDKDAGIVLIVEGRGQFQGLGVLGQAGGAGAHLRQRKGIAQGRIS